MRMPSGFPGDVQPPSQSVADLERLQYETAWHEALKSELAGHKTTGAHEAATPTRMRKTVCACWVFYETNKYGLIVKTKARVVAMGFSQVRWRFFLTFAPTPSLASVKILEAVANEHGFKMIHLDVAQAFFRTKHDDEIYMKLPDG